MSDTTKIGCCGFGMSKAKYFELYPAVEVQQTFYQPPSLATLAKWRAAAPDHFEFVLKAWQLITHTCKSPTFRRVTRALTAKELKDAGAFKSTRTVIEAFEATIACAEVLRAKSIIFQCPASFTPSEEHLDNLRTFFSSVYRPKNMRFYWEPRGDWDASLIRSLCTELGLFHAVDPFVNQSVTLDYLYFRMHGVGGWRHVYSESELVELAKKIQSAKNTGRNPARNPGRNSDKIPGQNSGKGARKNSRSDVDQGQPYIFFNNMTMTEDALCFKAILAKQTAETPA